VPVVNLFKKSTPVEAEVLAEPTLPPPLPPVVHLRPPPPSATQIPLTAEQKRILDQPLDSRVGRILREIYEGRLEASKGSGQIIRFPSDLSGPQHWTQDEEGNWHILSGQVGERGQMIY
jgi:hypothetical protein